MATHRIGFIGCGNMAIACHLGGFGRLEHTEITAITEPSEANRKRIAEKCEELKIEVPVLYDDYREMLGKEDLTAAAVFTPHTLHFQQTKDVLEADLDVLVEKPMVTSVDQAVELQDIVNKTGRVLSIGYPGAFSAYHKAARDFIASGKAGRITAASLRVMQGGWLKGTAGKWRQDPELSGGGQFYDTGSHLLNSLVWILDDSVSDLSGFMTKEGTEVDINGALSIWMSKGTLASVMIGGHGVKKVDEKIIFYGEEARIQTGIWGGEFTATDTDGNDITPDFGEVKGLHETFIEVIEGKAENPAPVKYGVYLSELMEKIYSKVVVTD